MKARKHRQIKDWIKNLFNENDILVLELQLKHS